MAAAARGRLGVPGGDPIAKTRIKTITAGRLIYICAYSQALAADDPAVRREKNLMSNAARSLLNHNTAARKLQLLLACNFGWRDRFATLTYRDDSLPANRKAAQAEVKAFLRRLRQQRRQRDQPLRYIYTTEEVPDAPGEDKRLHHHIIVNATGDARADVELLTSLWPCGNVDLELLGSGDTDDLAERARYMTKERHPGTVGRRTGLRGWVPSRGLRRPVASSVLVSDLSPPAPPPGAYVTETASKGNTYGSYYYLACIRPETRSHRGKMQ